MRFLTDVDEVLADFVNPAVEVICQVLGREWTFDEAPTDTWDIFSSFDDEVRRTIFEILYSPGWCRSLPVLEGAPEFIAELQGLLDNNVYAVTSHNNSPWWVFERDAWLLEEVDIDHQHSAHTHAKYLCSGDFLLDDRPDHVVRWQRDHPNGVGMLWTTQHNMRLGGYEDLRVHSYDQVIKTVKKRM